jgi:hypothetical protein
MILSDEPQIEQPVEAKTIYTAALERRERLDRARRVSAQA